MSATQHQSSSPNDQQLAPTSAPVSPVTSSSSPVVAAHHRHPPIPIQSTHRLLVPISHSVTASLSPASRVARKSTSGRLARSRAASVVSDNVPSPPTPDALSCLGPEFRFEVVKDDIVLFGFQVYAVEKWIVDRERRVKLLVVFTGDPKDKITVVALAPCSILSPLHHTREWDKAIHHLRRDGARPRETDNGVIMITSLANFRSDYTVVQIPDGNFLACRELLYANINLLRMGCSGRSALTLASPSDTTRDRFASMYHFNEGTRTQELFVATVLEFVKTLQSSLSLFDLFPQDIEEQDGLLCDQTVEGIDTWVANIGEPYAKIEPMERIADPTIVAALLSLILSIRNKLTVIGASHVPKDPFVHPRQLVRALAAFTNGRSHQHLSIFPLQSNNSAGSSFISPPEIHPTSQSPIQTHQTLELILRIDAAFDKARSSDAYKVHRVLRNKLDDFTATTSAIAAGAGRSRSNTGREHASSLSLSSLTGIISGSGIESILDVTPDLASLVLKMSLMKGRDGVPSLRYLWSGRLDELQRLRRDAAWSDAEVERERERERERVRSNEDDGVDGRSSEEEMEGLGMLPWSGRVHRKIGIWRDFARTRAKRSGADYGKEFSPHRPTKTTSLPAVIVSRDPDDNNMLSSGQVSPLSPSASMIALDSLSAHASAVEIDDAGFFRRLQNFNRLYPSSPLQAHVRARLRAGSQSGMLSWSDPVSAEELLEWSNLGGQAHEGTRGAETSLGAAFVLNVRGVGGEKGGVPASVAARLVNGNGAGADEFSPEGKRARARREFAGRLKRSFSFNDCELRKREDILQPSRMQIDVDLCAQCLITRRRRFHVEATMKCLQAVLQAASTSNDALKQELEVNKAAIHELDLRCTQLIADIEKARYETDAMSLDTNALRYEAGSFDIPTLWSMAQGPRQRVFAIRERVFGMGFAPQGAGRASAHGRFNRVQRKLDGSERLVDWLGRTESEVEEESDLPEIVPMTMISPVEELPAVGKAPSESVSASGIGQEKLSPSNGLPQTLSSGDWLLTMFRKWGRVLGALGGQTSAKPDEPRKTSVPSTSAAKPPASGTIEQEWPRP